MRTRLLILAGCIVIGLIGFLVMSAASKDTLVGIRDGARIVQRLITAVALACLIAILIIRFRGKKGGDDQTQHKRDGGMGD